MKTLRCPHCNINFMAEGNHVECEECRLPAMLARQGYGFEDLMAKTRIPRARARAIVFGKGAERKVA
jgi:hypothetical protein